MPEAEMTGRDLWSRFWCEALVHVLTQTGCKKPEVTPQELPGPAADAPDTSEWVKAAFRVSGCAAGHAVWNVPLAAARSFAQLLMSEPLEPQGEFGEDQKDAFAEMIRQVAGEAAVRWKRETGEELELVYEAATQIVEAEASRVALHCQGEELSPFTCLLEVDEECAKALRDWRTKVPVAPKPEAVSVETEGGGSLPANLNLILDVQLDATIRFGHREMLLRDIFGLMPGAVVELEQMVTEPADLLVAGRLVARGEVVVVDGNFGLRVTEVIRANQREAILAM